MDDISTDASAAAAGVHRGDVLITLGGQPVGVETLGERLGAGQTVPAVLVRGGARVEVSVRLAAPREIRRRLRGAP